VVAVKNLPWWKLNVQTKLTSFWMNFAMTWQGRQKLKIKTQKSFFCFCWLSTVIGNIPVNHLLCLLHAFVVFSRGNSQRSWRIDYLSGFFFDCIWKAINRKIRCGVKSTKAAHFQLICKVSLRKCKVSLLNFENFWKLCQCWISFLITNFIVKPPHDQNRLVGNTKYDIHGRRVFFQGG